MLRDGSEKLSAEETVATVAHDLRTPLTAIKGFLQTLQREDLDLSSAQVRMFLSIMDDQADRLERLIDDLRDLDPSLGRSADNLLKVSSRSLDLNQLVLRTLAAFSIARPETELRYEAADRDIEICADAKRVEQVLTNLLDNAVKHASSNGPITVRIAELPSEGAATLSVQDFGPGIPVNEQPRIFERNFIASNSSSHARSGAGLGLFICRTLTESMDGSISVTSRPNRGATFRVKLPLS